MSTGRDAYAERRRAFFTGAMTAAMPDAMDLILRRAPGSDDDRAFSVEAFESLAYQFHDFVMARTVAYIDRHKRPPSGLRARLVIDWDDAPSDAELARDNVPPWYAVTSPEDAPTPLPLDGNVRFRAFLDDRKGDA
jgi:hypothetical protein